MVLATDAAVVVASNVELVVKLELELLDALELGGNTAVFAAAGLTLATASVVMDALHWADHGSTTG